MTHVQFTAWEQLGVGGNGYLDTLAISPLGTSHDVTAAIAIGLDCGGPFVSYDRGDS